jgi:hypothetical protein
LELIQWLGLSLETFLLFDPMVDMQQDHLIGRLLDDFCLRKKSQSTSFSSPFGRGIPTLVFFIINSPFLHQNI